MKQSRQMDFGKRSGLKCYPVSIGAMRLPKEEDEAVALLRQAIDANMVYIDTSRGYGDSEIKVGKALKDGYRDKVILSTKWSSWVADDKLEDTTAADRMYQTILESLERLDVQYVDFYQIWNIASPENYDLAIAKNGLLEGITRAIDEGLVKHTGFTTHDKPENVSRYIDEADWCEAILFSYNILNYEHEEVIAKARDKGIATLVMNPLGGGRLVHNSAILCEATGYESVAEMSHRFIAGNANVDTILCGMQKPSDITSTLAHYAKPLLDEKGRQAIKDALVRYSSKEMGFCTACNYCMPCEQGLNIPVIMEGVYLHKYLQIKQFALEHLTYCNDPANNYVPYSKCSQCGACEEKCTQKLNIIEEIKYARRVLGELTDE